MLGYAYQSGERIFQMNIMNLMQLKEAWGVFKENHPKFPLFLNAASKNGLKEGSVVEITITPPEGKSITTNIKIKESDLKLFDQLKSAFK
jgi:hypothetical protein